MTFVFLSYTALCAGAVHKSLLRDGFVLTGIDGKLTGANNKWFFKFDSAVSDDGRLLKAGSNIELLPSAALEKMGADMEKHSAATYRLWGRVTKYKGRNFIFPIYFLPISKTSEPQSLTSQKSQQQETKPTINEPNDALAMPQEIIEKLKTRKIVRMAQLRKGLELETDCILADRTGFIIKQNEGGLGFTLDALGRNAGQLSLRLLPCQTLEQAQRKQSAEPDPLRFKAAGIVTKYRGQYYLLLQRAIRVYSHANFTR